MFKNIHKNGSKCLQLKNTYFKEKNKVFYLSSNVSDKVVLLPTVPSNVLVIYVHVLHSKEHGR